MTPRFARTFKKGDSVTLTGRRDRGSVVRVDFTTMPPTALVEWPNESRSVYNLDDLRHAPVVVIGPTTSRPTTCPDCGSPLFNDPYAIVWKPDPSGHFHKRETLLTACSGCEYVVEG